MSRRTAFIISCSPQEARSIRQRAQHDRRTISGYVLNTLMRAVSMDEELLAQRPGLFQLYCTLGKIPRRAAGATTTTLIHCASEDADRVRRAAREKGVTISGYVLQHLARAWTVSDQLTKIRNGLNRHNEHLRKTSQAG